MPAVVKHGADMVVDSLINHDVDYVFGIPGAKIDRVFDTLEDKGPELIVTRHEQNAAFMAQAVGRITGKPGVVIATSGPGARIMRHYLNQSQNTVLKFKIQKQFLR